MSNIRLIGLTSIKVGDVGATGAMATTLETITAIVPDSAHLVMEAPGVTDLFVEEEDLPDIQILGTSKKTVEFATRDMGGAMFEKAFGGAYTSPVGTTLGSWSASTAGAVDIKEFAIEAISKTYNGKKLKVEIPRASVHAGADLRFTKTESGQITFSCDVLIPASSTKISPIKITETA
jgi:hypothetical protein